jgi:mRNA-degrading endonuclease RelE of RelBE toxin-antitoxin system
MEFNIVFTPKVRDEMHELKEDHAMEHHLKEVQKALDFLAHNPKHPGLHTHKYHNLEGAHGEEVFEAYAENHTPGAYRIFWHYGPGKGIITVIDIIHHPKK